MNATIRDYRFVLKPVFTRSGSHTRLVRLTVDRPRVKPGEGWLYRQLSIGFKRRLWSYSEGFREGFLIILGLRLHWSESLGGGCADS